MADDKRAYFQRCVHSALDQVRGGQHLRFIKAAFLTLDVCLAALRHEVSHTDTPFDVYAVPVAHIEAVVAAVKAETPGRAFLHRHLDAAVADRKRRASEPGYFGETRMCAQDVIDRHGASDWDDMLERSFVKRCVG